MKKTVTLIMQSILAGGVTGFLAVSTATLRADGYSTNAYDNADLASYTPIPDHWWSTNNGGYGYGPWLPLAGITGGGTYMEGIDVNNGQVDGSYSFGLWAGSGGMAISRPLSNSLTAGEFDVLTRFWVTGEATNLVSVRTGNGGFFETGELLAFGLGPQTNGATTKHVLVYRDAAGLHFTSSPADSRGLIWQWQVHFDTFAGTYMLYVTNVGVASGYSNFFQGNLEQSGTSAGSFAVINPNSGDSQNLVFDSPTFLRPPTNPAPPEFKGATYLSVPAPPGPPVNYLVSTINVTPWTTNQVQYKTDMHQAYWSNLGSAIIPTGSQVGWFDYVGPDPRRFYRVVRLP